MLQADVNGTTNAEGERLLDPVDPSPSLVIPEPALAGAVLEGLDSRAVRVDVTHFPPLVTIRLTPAFGCVDHSPLDTGCCCQGTADPSSARIASRCTARRLYASHSPIRARSAIPGASSRNFATPVFGIAPISCR